MDKIKLFIHIGTHKTGTTSIQKAFKQNPDSLKNEGVCFLDEPVNKITRNKLVHSKSLNKDLVDNVRDEFSAKIKKAVDKGCHVLVSSCEELSGNVIEGYKNTRLVAEALFASLTDLPLQTKIVVYLRRQDSFIESLYCQMIHIGETYDFKTFIKNFNQTHFNWYNLVKDYSHVFGKENIIVRIYNKDISIDSNYLIRDFGKVIENNFLIKSDLKPTYNRSYSNDMIEVLRVTNSSFSCEDSIELRRFFKTINTKPIFESNNYFNYDERLAFLNKYQHSNTLLAKEYLDSDIIFNDPKPYIGNINQQLSIDSLTLLFTSSIINLNQQIFELSNEIKSRKSKSIIDYIRTLFF